MLVLALDTSAEIAVSLVTGDADAGVRVLADRRVAEQRRHAELLAPMIAAALVDGGVDRRDLDAVVVGTGPAPFTGLRAGLVTARTLAFALSIPCHGVGSLDALAAEAFDRSAADDVLVATDARRRELYVARYRRPSTAGRTGGETRDVDGQPGAVDDVDLLAGPAVVRPQDLADGWTAGQVVGAGALLYPEHLTMAPGAPTAPDPAVLARLALRRASRGTEQGTEPLYLRRPDVTPATGRRRVS